MTTYDVGSASRRALMTLASSLPSAAGLKPNPIDEIDTPEERLAARMVRRFALEPPVDVERVAAALATVSVKRFPIAIDGLCLDLKISGKRPKIWLSQELGPIRRRFTLAHEIGHIVIPWHTGSIVDDLEAPRTIERGRYREMEAEANRFAAELLMPTAWVKGTSSRSNHASSLMNTIVQVADVSFPAAQFRVQKLGPPGYVGAEVRNDIVVWSARTKGTRAKPPPIGSAIADFDARLFEAPRALTNISSRYLWWKVRDEIAAPPSPSAPWREILENILLSIPEEERDVTRSRVNAVVGYAIGRLPKGTEVDRIYQRGLEACENRTDRDRWLRAVFAHPNFSAYLLARCYDRARAID